MCICKYVGEYPMIKLRINLIVANDLKNIKEYIAEDNEEVEVLEMLNFQDFPCLSGGLYGHRQYFFSGGNGCLRTFPGYCD